MRGLVTTALLAGLLLAAGVGCTTRAPMAVRFGREVDAERLAELPRRGGKVVLLVDAAFWTDQQRVTRIPIARRASTFIVGPGAAAMTKRMLEQVFDEVTETRLLDRVEDLKRFDYVIRLVHDAFDSRTLFLPLLTNRRYEVGIGAELSRADGYPLSRVSGVGADSFWLLSLSPENRLEGDARVAARASVTLNAAVQEALFELVAALDRALGPAPASR